MFKERALEGLSIETRNRLSARGIFFGEDFFGKSIKIDEIEDRRYVSDQEVFEVCLNMARQINPLECETLISDEVGGRLITRFLWKFINIKREASGMSRLKNVFFLRPKDKDIPFVDSFVEKRQESLGKTLVVTELIRNGNGTRRMGDVLGKYGLKFGVASISAVKKDTIPALISEYGIEVVSVGEMDLLGTGEVFHRRGFNGVKQGDYYSGSAHPERDFDCDQDEINLSRKVIRLMAQEAAKII